MKFPVALLAATLIVSLAPALHAQSTLVPSNDALSAKVAALQQALDKLQGDYGRLLAKCPSVPTPTLAPAAAATTAVAPTLAEAAAEAAKIQHSWPLSENLGTYRPAAVSADNPPPELARVVASIKARCLAEYPSNSVARNFCASEKITPLLETSALNKSGVLDSPAGEVIRLKCLHDWPNDGALFNRCVQAELKTR